MDRINCALLLNDHLPLNPQEDGYIGDQFSEKNKIRLTINIPADMDGVKIFQFKSAGRKEIAEMKNISSNPAVRSYATTFAIKKTASGVLRPLMTHNASNYVMANSVSENWRIGLVSQNGKFYFLKRKFSPALESEENMPTNLGRVKWADIFSGVACLQANGREARVYWDAFIGIDGLIEPHQYQYVVFNRLARPRDAGTSFKWEVAGGAWLFENQPTESEILATLEKLRKPATPVFTGWGRIGDLLDTTKK